MTSFGSSVTEFDANPKSVTNKGHIRMTQEISISGLWFAAWLFTIGYAKLGVFSGLLAVIFWPYFLGSAAAH